MGVQSRARCGSCGPGARGAARQGLGDSKVASCWELPGARWPRPVQEVLSHLCPEPHPASRAPSAQVTPGHSATGRAAAALAFGKQRQVRSMTRRSPRNRPGPQCTGPPAPQSPLSPPAVRVLPCLCVPYRPGGGFLTSAPASATGCTRTWGVAYNCIVYDALKSLTFPQGPCGVPCSPDGVCVRVPRSRRASRNRRSLSGAREGGRTSATRVHAGGAARPPNRSFPHPHGVQTGWGELPERLALRRDRRR